MCRGKDYYLTKTNTEQITTSAQHVPRVLRQTRDDSDVAFVTMTTVSVTFAVIIFFASTPTPLLCFASRRTVRSSRTTLGVFVSWCFSTVFGRWCFDGDSAFGRWTRSRSSLAGMAPRPPSSLALTPWAHAISRQIGFSCWAVALALSMARQLRCASACARCSLLGAGGDLDDQVRLCCTAWMTRHSTRPSIYSYGC